MPFYGFSGINDGLNNLNHAAWEIDRPGLDEESGLSDPSTETLAGHIRVHFRNLDTQLLSYIGQAGVVVGCVAWLTHPVILEALAMVPHGVALVVQKEDFLRPDMEEVVGGRRSVSWQHQLKTQYNRLRFGPDRHSYPSPLAKLSVCSDPSLDPVRCVGNYNEARLPAFPRMHNKFLIFCHISKEYEPPEDEYDIYGPQGYWFNHWWIRDEYEELDGFETVIPDAVWTGSFNLTKNATHSLENALYITSPDIVQAYFLEWAQIEALSEPLDWEHVWCTPEWRIGT